MPHRGQTRWGENSVRGSCAGRGSSIDTLSQASTPVMQTQLAPPRSEPSNAPPPDPGDLPDTVEGWQNRLFGTPAVSSTDEIVFDVLDACRKRPALAEHIRRAATTGERLFHRDNEPFTIDTARREVAA